MNVDQQQASVGPLSTKESYTRNQERLKKQIVELQAQLLASQDKVSELQRRLLATRGIVNAPI